MSDLGPKLQQNEQPCGCKDDLCVFPLRTAVIITKQLVPLGQLPEPGFCTMSPVALPLCGNLMRSSGWALGERCPLLDGGCTCASDLEEEAALGIWNAVRKAHPLGKRRTVTRVMNFGAYLSSTTTIPKNQPVDRLHLSSAQLIPGPTARNVPTCHPGVLSVLDQADESGTLVPQTAGMCVTESVRAASVEEASVWEVVRGWRGR